MIRRQAHNMIKVYAGPIAAPPDTLLHGRRISRFQSEFARTESLSALLTIAFPAQNQDAIFEMESPPDKDKDGADNCHRQWPNYQPEQMMSATTRFQYAQ